MFRCYGKEEAGTAQHFKILKINKTKNQNESISQQSLADDCWLHKTNKT